MYKKTKTILTIRVLTITWITKPKIKNNNNNDNKHLLQNKKYKFNLNKILTTKYGQ